MTPTSVASPRVLIPGYNHDIPYLGKLYHVQTEQITRAGGCHIVTEVYEDGRVVGGHRAAWQGPTEDESGHRSLAIQVRHQHKSAIKCILVGKLSLLENSLNDRHSLPRKENPAQSDATSRPVWTPKLSRVTPTHSASQDLGSRRALIRFVRAVGRVAPQSPAETRDRLRSIVASIAVLFNHHVERHLRQDDLAELVMKRSESGTYLRNNAADDMSVGLELWKAFAELARLFAPVNDRAALRAHDLEALTRALARWARLDDLDQLPDPTSLALLQSCWGRDAVIDELLDDRRTLTIALLLTEVTRVALELEAHVE